ncbi:MAG: hypothetical protein A2Y13_07155 [Planctomycetes bacterium GWC2_45_44]|nr:MAG: hypothetical protein A2Y13_07155 [Planctomycetes bacterium GWC2_45_44]
MKKIIILAVVVCMMAVVDVALTDTIRGINIDFVTIGNPRHTRTEADSNGCSAIHYVYRIGKYEVTNAQWNAFASVAGVPTGNPSYAYDQNTSSAVAQQPTNNVSWYEAAQFCNYLTSGDKSCGVYQFTGNNANPGDFVGVNRASAQVFYGLIYFLPTEDEWFKAAYYKSDGTGYSLYANGRNTIPAAGNGWNYYKGGAYGEPWNVGAGTQEQNGTFDMMGNVWEWTEARSSTSYCGARGGSCGSSDIFLRSSPVISYEPSDESCFGGFRVASLSVPCNMGLPPLVSIEKAAPANLIKLGNWQYMKDRNAHRIGISPVLRIETQAKRAAIEAIGWDTEGGSRAKLNIIKSPIVLLTLAGGNWQSSADMDAKVIAREPNMVKYELKTSAGYGLTWGITAKDNGGFNMRFASVGSQNIPEKISLVLPFNQRLASATVISGNWIDEKTTKFPLIISVPDIGQMHVSSPLRPDITAFATGNREAAEMTITMQLPVPDEQGYEIIFDPLILPMPAEINDQKQWLQARRGWFNLLQFSILSQQRGENIPAGLWANNTLSDPVSSTVFMLGDVALLMPKLAPDIPIWPILRRTVEYWMYEKLGPNGGIIYCAYVSPEMMDSNPSVVIGAWAYIKGTDDIEWLRKNIERLEFIASYTESRDIDDDGIIESPNSGNRGTRIFGDTCFDTYSSGHKNAYVNMLAYRAFKCMAQLEQKLDNQQRYDRYSARADAIKSKFVATFYNPETGWLGWWRSRDGYLHDVWSDVPTSMAIMYGLVDRESGRKMMDSLWVVLQKSGFKRFDIGIPLNSRPVPREDQFSGYAAPKKEDGSDTFGKYLNGGCFGMTNVYFLTASKMVGAEERYNKVMTAMLDRQEKGVFPNGGGFQNGFVDKSFDGAEVFDWQGIPCGYEGHLVYSWKFLDALFLGDAEVRNQLLLAK